MNNTNKSDSAFILKILLYFILGAFWLRFESVELIGGIDFALPLGLLIGILFARHDHFLIDRRIEYVVLLLSVILSFFLPTGIIF